MPNGDELKMDAKETASEDNPQARGVRKLRGRVIAAVVIAVAAVIAAASYWYVSYQIPHNNAVAEFETAVEALNDKNEELDSAISDLQDLMGSGEQPLDSSTLDAASAAIGVAQAGKETAPDMPEETEEIIAAASEVDEMGDYSDLIEALVSAQTNLRNSIAQLRQVTNPSEQFVIERLMGLPNVTGVEAATEQNDPNGNLHKDGGYTSAVFFSSDLVDQSQVYLDDAYTGIPSAGTDGGGCVEVFATTEDAEKRNTYLSAFDGSILRPGSHMVLGTCVVRISDLLTASQQDAMEQAICDSLTQLQ